MNLAEEAQMLLPHTMAIQHFLCSQNKKEAEEADEQLGEAEEK